MSKRLSIDQMLFCSPDADRFCPPGQYCRTFESTPKVHRAGNTCDLVTSAGHPRMSNGLRALAFGKK